MIQKVGHRRKNLNNQLNEIIQGFTKKVSDNLRNIEMFTEIKREGEVINKFTNIFITKFLSKGILINEETEELMYNNQSSDYLYTNGLITFNE